MDNSKKTIVVLGCYRGGTSMVAGILRCLGVFMGERFGEEAGGSNHEDLDLQLKPIGELRKLIAKRNDEHGTWGWKDPSSVFKMDQVVSDLRNPYFISVFRDPQAIALSESRYTKRPIKEGLKIGIGHLAQLSMFCIGTDKPNLMLSYEKALANRDSLVDEVILFLDLIVSSDQRQKAVDFITPERYTKI